MKLASTDIAPLLMALRSGYFRRAGVRVTACASPDALMAEVRARAPDVVVVDPAVGGSAPLTRALRRALPPPALLLLALARGGAAAIELSCFDGVMALTAPAESLLRFLGDRLPPARACRRRRARLPLQVFALGRETVCAEAIDSVCRRRGRPSSRRARRRRRALVPAR